MNILPKKRWHVRTKENIARVRKDEAEAAEKAKEEERRAKLAEQEARTAFLRKRARENNTSNEENVEISRKVDKTEADIYTSSGNINFFKEIEAGIQSSGTNKEHEEEKKAEKELYEKKIGVLKYLGQDTFESSGKVAWYIDEKSSFGKVCSGSHSKEENDEVGMKSKITIDPLKEIMKHTGRKTYNNAETFVKSTPSNLDNHRNKNLCRKDNKHKKKKKHNYSKKKKSKLDSSKKSSHKKKRKRKKSSSSNYETESEDENEKQVKLEKLRKERLEREAYERKREERLIAGKNPDEEDKKSENVGPFKQKYNSQFNPHLAKQNRPSELQSGVKYWLK